MSKWLEMFQTIGKYFIFWLFFAVVKGIILMKMWDWFIMPSFGLPAISFPVAVGIGLIFSFFIGRSAVDNNDKNEFIIAIEILLRDLCFFSMAFIFSLLV